MSVEIPYEPIERPRVSFERMQEILNKWSQLGREMWLVARVKRGAPKSIKAKAVNEIFDGVTTQDLRKVRVRQCIVDFGIARCACGRREGKPVTFGQMFEFVFGEPL